MARNSVRSRDAALARRPQAQARTMRTRPRVAQRPRPRPCGAVQQAAAQGRLTWSRCTQGKACLSGRPLARAWLRHVLLCEDSPLLCGRLPCSALPINGQALRSSATHLRRSGPQPRGRARPASALPLRCSLRTALYSHPVIALSTLYLLRYPTRVPLTLAPLWCTACAMSYVACALRCPRACT